MNLLFEFFDSEICILNLLYPSHVPTQFCLTGPLTLNTLTYLTVKLTVSRCIH